MRVIGVTSGKGGVGKTTVSVNLAVELAKRGKRVVLLDGDLGLSNAQILLNARVEYSYGHVLSGQKTLEEIMVQSEYGVTLVPGSSGSSALARLTRLQLLGLIHALSALDECDYLVVDTAAGISDNVTVLFGACDIKLLLIQNELSSIADTYATVKVLQQEFNLSDIMLTPVHSPEVRKHPQAHQQGDSAVSGTLEYSTGIESGGVELSRLSQPAILHALESDIAKDIRRLVDVITESAANLPTQVTSEYR